MTNLDSTSSKNHSTNSTTYSKRRFTPSEDNIIISLAKPNCSNDWSIIAKSVEKRSARQCRDRWNNYLNPNLNKDEWIPEEDELLMKIFNEKGPQWKSFSIIFKGRSINNVRNRCFKLLRKSQSNRSSSRFLEHQKNHQILYKKIDQTRNERFNLEQKIEEKYDESQIKDQCENINPYIPPDQQITDDNHKLKTNQIDNKKVLDVDYFFYDIDDDPSHKSNNLIPKQEERDSAQNSKNEKNNIQQCPIDTSVVDKLMSKLERELYPPDLFSWTSNFDIGMEEVSHPNII